MYLFRNDEPTGTAGSGEVESNEHNINRKKEIAVAVLKGESVSEVARLHKVSRKFVYQQKERALRAIEEAFAPTATQREKSVPEIQLNKAQGINSFLLWSCVDDRRTEPSSGFTATFLTIEYHWAPSAASSHKRP